MEDQSSSHEKCQVLGVMQGQTVQDEAFKDAQSEGAERSHDSKEDRGQGQHEL